MNDHVLELKNRLRNMSKKAPPSPWKHVATIPVGGLREVGYAENTDLLLVVSTDGRGLFNCKTGERLARDQTPLHEGNWCDEEKLCAGGIGIVAGLTISLAGLFGGGLAKYTGDGWGLELVAPDWPSESIILCPPGANVYVERLAVNCVKIEDNESYRAYGFSQTGQSFVVAWSSDLSIYTRV